MPGAVGEPTQVCDESHVARSLAGLERHKTGLPLSSVACAQRSDVPLPQRTSRATARTRSAEPRSLGPWVGLWSRSEIEGELRGISSASLPSHPTESLRDVTRFSHRTDRPKWAATAQAALSINRIDAGQQFGPRHATFLNPRPHVLDREGELKNRCGPWNNRAPHFRGRGQNSRVANLMLRRGRNEPREASQKLNR